MATTTPNPRSLRKEPSPLPSRRAVVMIRKERVVVVIGERDPTPSHVVEPLHLPLRREYSRLHFQESAGQRPNCVQSAGDSILFKPTKDYGKPGSRKTKTEAAVIRLALTIRVQCSSSEESDGELEDLRSRVDGVNQKDREKMRGKRWQDPGDNTIAFEGSVHVSRRLNGALHETLRR
jgi:hypothetical protein